MSGLRDVLRVQNELERESWVTADQIRAVQFAVGAADARVFLPCESYTTYIRVWWDPLDMLDIPSIIRSLWS